MGLSPRTLRPANNFTPRSITGLALWLDASDASSLYTTDAGAVTPVSSPTEIAGCVGWWDASDAASITQSGGSVSQINDKSGLAAHASQGTSGSRPTLIDNALNGRSILRFDGGDGLTGNFASSINTGAYSVFAVCKVTSMVTNGRVFSVAGASSDFASGMMIPCCTNASSVSQLSAYDGASGANKGAVDGFTSYAVFSGVVGTSSLTNAANGMRAASASVTLNTAVTRFGIGTPAQGGAGGWNGDIAEVIYYSAALSNADRARVEAYLAAKWGISGVHTPATATSDPVGAWLDKSGNARHATQSTAGSRPTISATALNGKKQLGLISQHLRGPSTTWTGSASIYWVGRTGQSANGAFVFGDGTTDQTDGFHAGWLNTAGVGAYGNGWQSGNAPRAESPSAWRNADVVAGVTLSSTEAIARVNGATTNTTAALTGSLSQSAAAQFYIGRESSGTWNNINGSLAELLIYQPALNASQRLRLERYLAAKYGITLAPTVSNADAQDWINRVYANGGTVSSSTAAAVNTFCDAIDSASIRDRFYRMNLFAGGTSGTTTGLAACLVPLYRGPSLGGTQYGNTTDTNVGPFAVGDYAETGASGGLAGNGSTKYLNTGFPTNTLPEGNRHISVYEQAKSTSLYRFSIGSEGASANSQWFSLGVFDPIGNYRFGFGSSSGGVDATSYSGGAMWLGSNAATGSGTLYKNGVSAVTGSLTAATPTSSEMWVFNLNRQGTSGGVSNARLGSYSVGLGMTAAQAAAYYTAMQAFQTALSRNVG